MAAGKNQKITHLPELFGSFIENGTYSLLEVYNYTGYKANLCNILRYYFRVKYK